MLPTNQNQISYMQSVVSPLDSLLGFLVIHLLVTFKMMLLKGKVKPIKVFKSLLEQKSL